MDIIYNEENALKRKNEYDEKLKLKHEKKIKEREKEKKFLTALLPIIIVSAVITGTCDFFALINEKTLPTVILFIITVLLGIGILMAYLMRADATDAIDDINCCYDNKIGQFKYPIDVQLYDLFKEYKLLAVKTDKRNDNYMRCLFTLENLATGEIKEGSHWFDIRISTKYDKEILDLENHTLYLPYKNTEPNDFEIKKEMWKEELKWK